MAGGDDSLQSISVRLDGKNFGYWSYVMINFLKGKGLWDYVCGKSVCPKSGDEKFEELFRIWETNNSKIITWINNSVEQRIGIQLAKFKTAKDIWDYLSKLFVQNNFAIKYQLQSEIRALVQNDLGIQDYFCAMTALWDQLALTESVELQACDAYIKCRDEDRLVQLLMGLRPEFDNCRSGLLHRKPLPSVEDVVNELMAEETCLKTLKGAHSASTSVLAVPPSAPVLAAPTNQYKTSSVGNCNYCKQPGHWKHQCPELRKGSSWKPPQPRAQGYKPTTQSHGGQHKHYPHPPTQAALVPSLNQSGSEAIGNSSPDSLANQFQQFLAFQQYQNSTQSPALSVPCPSPPLTGSGLQDSSCSSLNHLKGSLIMDIKEDTLLLETSPTAAPQPLLPLFAPSPLAPFTNSTSPKLSGLCTLNFDAVESMMAVTSIDCVAPFAEYLANVMCCPQLETTLVILIGQSSKHSNILALNGTLAKHCLSDFQQLLVSQGANDTLQQICSLHLENLTEGSCPVKDVHEFETTVDSSSLLAACGKIDLVNECCEETCGNAITEAAKKLALKAYDISRMDGPHVLSDHTTRVNDCKRIVHRWLASKLKPAGAKHVLRGLSNCKNNKVCPLVFPNMKNITKACGDGMNNQTTCCNTVERYVSHLQRQSFVTNFQALDCAASLGVKLQKDNVSKNVYNLCHISLKDFSVQVAPEVSGCLLPSLPSDAILDKTMGISFVCDLNDNIPAPWPSMSQLPASSCKKPVRIPALPAVASGQIRLNIWPHLLLVASMILEVCCIYNAAILS